MLFMSPRQMAHVCHTVDFSRPQIFEQTYFMAAAFRVAHRDFRLLRERPVIPMHFVTHQDNWTHRNSFPLEKRQSACID
jgi:hypothetical protein